MVTADDRHYCTRVEMARFPGNHDAGFYFSLIGCGRVLGETVTDDVDSLNPCCLFFACSVVPSLVCLRPYVVTGV